jgi:hypothetical protein
MSLLLPPPRRPALLWKYRPLGPVHCRHWPPNTSLSSSALHRSLSHAILSTWAIHCVLHFKVTSMRCSLIVSLPMWSLNLYRETLWVIPSVVLSVPRCLKFSTRTFQVQTSSLLYYFIKTGLNLFWHNCYNITFNWSASFITIPYDYFLVLVSINADYISEHLNVPLNITLCDFHQHQKFSHYVLSPWFPHILLFTPLTP